MTFVTPSCGCLMPDLLPDIIIADGADDVVDVLEHTDDGARLRLGENLRTAILRGHTGTARAAELEGLIESVQRGAASRQEAAA